MQVEKILKALANRRRLAILKLLEKDRLTVSETSIAIHLFVRSTSKHLQVLAKADIVDREQTGPNIYYLFIEPQHPVVTAALTLVSFVRMCE